MVNYCPLSPGFVVGKGEGRKSDQKGPEENGGGGADPSTVIILYI